MTYHIWAGEDLRILNEKIEEFYQLENGQTIYAFYSRCPPHLKNKIGYFIRNLRNGKTVSDKIRESIPALKLWDEPPPKIKRALESFCIRFSTDDFNITSHASHRMVQRGVTYADLVKTVTEGETATGRVVYNWIGGKFIYDGLTVLVYAPYCIKGARPVVITVYWRGEEPDFPDVETFTEVGGVNVGQPEPVRNGLNLTRRAPLELVHEVHEVPKPCTPKVKEVLITDLLSTDLFDIQPVIQPKESKMEDPIQVMAKMIADMEAKHKADMAHMTTMLQSAINQKQENFLHEFGVWEKKDLYFQAEALKCQEEEDTALELYNQAREANSRIQVQYQAFRAEPESVKMLNYRDHGPAQEAPSAPEPAPVTPAPALVKMDKQTRLDTEGGFSQEFIESIRNGNLLLKGGNSVIMSKLYRFCSHRGWRVSEKLSFSELVEFIYENL